MTNYVWHYVCYLSESPVPRVVRWYLETSQKEGSVRNLSFTPKDNKVRVSYEWRSKLRERPAFPTPPR